MRRSCQKFSGSEVEQHVGSCGASTSPPVQDAEMLRGTGNWAESVFGERTSGNFLLSLSDVQKHPYISATAKMPPKSCLPPQHQCSLRQQEMLWVYRTVIGGEKLQLGKFAPCGGNADKCKIWKSRNIIMLVTKK